MHLQIFYKKCRPMLALSMEEGNIHALNDDNYIVK